MYLTLAVPPTPKAIQGKKKMLLSLAWDVMNASRVQHEHPKVSVTESTSGIYHDLFSSVETNHEQATSTHQVVYTANSSSNAPSRAAMSILNWESRWSFRAQLGLHVLVHDKMPAAMRCYAAMILGVVTVKYNNTTSPRNKPADMTTFPLWNHLNKEATDSSGCIKLHLRK